MNGNNTIDDSFIAEELIFITITCATSGSVAQW